MGWLNVGSFVLGLIAWILPIFHLEKSREKRFALSVASFSACGIALCFQIFYINHVVNLEDFVALMDTMSAVAFASAVLLIVTIVLNAISLLFHRNQK